MTLAFNTESNVDETLDSSDSVQNMQTSWCSEHHNICNSISVLSDKIKGLCDHNDQLQNQIIINTTISSLNTAIYTLPYMHHHQILQNLLMNI